MEPNLCTTILSYISVCMSLLCLAGAGPRGAMCCVGSDKAPPTHTFLSRTHSTALMLGMQALREQGALCDVTLEVEESSLQVHRLVLAAASPFFRAMFGAGMQESMSRVVKLRGVHSAAIKSLVEYTYTSQLILSPGDTSDLLVASDMLQFAEVKQACCDYLQCRMDATNCLDMLSLAETHNCRKLQRAAQLCRDLHFPAVTKLPAFLQLPLEKVEAYLSSNYLAVDGEWEVIEAALSWLRHDVDQRLPHLSSMLGLVRLPLLSPQCLLEQVWLEPLISTNPACMELLRTALTFHLHCATNPQVSAFIVCTCIYMCAV